MRTLGLEPSGPLGAYAGTFRAGRGIDVTFRDEGEVLHVQSPAGHAELVQLSEDRFEVPNTARFTFARDDDGRVTSVTIVFGDQTFEAPRV